MNRAKKKIIQAKILSNRKITADHFLLKLQSAYLAAHSSPGQFVSVKAQKNSTDPLLRIPLGVHAVRKQGIDLLYKVVGQGTGILSERQKGETLNVLGPLGNGFDLSGMLRRKDDTAVLVAGGHGIAPLYAAAQVLSKKGIRIDFFIGAGSGNHIVCVEEIKRLGAKVHVATDDGTRGHKGYVTELVDPFLKRVTTGHGPRVTMYACGPRPMLGVLAGCVKKHDITAQFSLDAYMACGIGACLGCAIMTRNGYKLVCKDGPVFAAGDVDWENLETGS